jgi:hypothetical protein
MQVFSTYIVEDLTVPGKKETYVQTPEKKVLSTCSSFKTQDFGEAYYKSWCGMLTKTDLLIQMIRFSTKV